MIVVEKWKKITIVYSDMMLMSKHYSSNAFALSVTVMLLLTELTSVPGDKSIGIEYCRKICEKSIANTCPSTRKLLSMLLV